MPNRVLLYFLSIILMVAGSIGCQKRMRVINPSLVPYPQSDHNKFAHVVVDVCDLEKQAIRAKQPGGDFQDHLLFFCSEWAKVVEKDLEKIKSKKLKELVKKYNSSRPKDDRLCRAKED